jgi:hypothetical protein
MSARPVSFTGPTARHCQSRPPSSAASESRTFSSAGVAARSCYFVRQNRPRNGHERQFLPCSDPITSRITTRQGTPAPPGTSLSGAYPGSGIGFLSRKHRNRPASPKGVADAAHRSLKSEYSQTATDQFATLRCSRPRGRARRPARNHQPKPAACRKCGTTRSS